MTRIMVQQITPVAVTINDEGDQMDADCLISNPQGTWFGVIMEPLQHLNDSRINPQDAGEADYLQDNGEHIPVPQARHAILDTYFLNE